MSQWPGLQYVAHPGDGPSLVFAPSGAQPVGRMYIYIINLFKPKNAHHSGASPVVDFDEFA